MPVREATIDDLFPLMNLFREFHYEDPFYSQVPFDAEVTAGTIIRGISTPEYRFWVYDIKGEIVGALYAYTSNYPFSNRIQAIEEVFYVSRYFRNKAIGIRLIDAFIKWGREIGADIYTNPRSQVDLAGILRALKSKGFVRHGINMVLKRG